MKILLIDGDILLYRFGFTNEYTIEWEPGVTSDVINGETAVAQLERFIADLAENSGAKKGNPIIAFSGAENFRYTVLPTYKHNRVDKAKPKLFYDLKNYLKENFMYVEVDGIEGDDAIGILMTKFVGRYTSASVDKDLLQIPGQHYNWDHDKTVVVDEAQADRAFYTQVLTGDSTDGYSGIPKIGPVKASKILAGCQDHKEYWARIVGAYEEVGLTEADALQQARVARILRAEDWSGEGLTDGHVILWTPKH